MIIQSKKLKQEKRKKFWGKLWRKLTFKPEPLPDKPKATLYLRGQIVKKYAYKHNQSLLWGYTTGRNTSEAIEKAEKDLKKKYPKRKIKILSIWEVTQETKQKPNKEEPF